MRTPAPTQAPAQALQLGVVVIQTTGGWGRISVDGAFRREGTSHRDTVPPGTHTVHVERLGYASVDTTVTVRAGETQLVRVTMRRGTP
ncbi:MAG: PEGA domain-containing protein [Gemmatimonadetes bacterium]|nr:PEGA domain-containing protein [Gemmatimonadota bacterium]